MKFFLNQTTIYKFPETHFLFFAQKSIFFFKRLVREGKLRLITRYSVTLFLFYFYGSINGFPVYKNVTTGITSEKILKICVNQEVPKEKICSTVPAGVTESAGFVVDLEAVSYKDLTVDGNGVQYGAHSSLSENFQVFLDGQGKISAMTRIGRSNSEAKRSLLNAFDLFTIRRQYGWSSQSKDFQHMIAKVEHEDKFLRLAVMQYTVEMTPQEAKMLLSKPYGSS